ncbi:RNA polymerase sigma-70 factor [Phocaeicola faecicola]|jgi:RNA polymerase sigma-70 factor (family 1)|uniref:RNA polymerase sigma-70 factor n=1 Tax=Phocaeicola faecicola TaxID=2739389 RepID=UPI0015B39BE4|nr:RNA polymerase sigma-70 factor [Phocaeicola faecicola]MCI5742433.1 RNA polymerase sigma-70 factor [Bacteroides sp.]MDD6909556.1 RNA polymerase sigma-70 factor [Bacteroidaceae bacterium]MDY4871452.1 RNA polymerase sigma-70 factor [Phocaeicola faecicola]
MNTESFKNIFLLYYRPLCLFAIHYLKNIDNAEDIVQDCFTEIWARKDYVDDIENLKSYLFTMVRNRCIDRLREDIDIDSSIRPSDLEDIIPDEECEERSFDEARMWTILDTLPIKCRKVFLLAKRDGMKYEEIAEEMNISVNTVRNQMNKAFKMLEERVHKIYLFFFG